MSPTLLAILLRAERQMQSDVRFSRRWYRKTGMSKREIAYYGDRSAWPDAVQLVQRNGAGPFLPYQGTLQAT